MEKQLVLRNLGKSDLKVSPIGLGCWQFSNRKGIAGKYWQEVGIEKTKEIIKTSMDRGVNFFDTAEMYGGGESENMLSTSLQKLNIFSGDVIIATKWSPLLRTARSITNTIETRIKALNNYRIDLYQIHHPMSFSSIKSEMREMAKLVKSEKISYVGISNYSAKQMELAFNELQKFDLHLISNQVKYSLLDRRIETNGILETAKKLGISIIAYSPLAQGILTARFHDNSETIKKIRGFRKYSKDFKQKGLKKSYPVIKVLKEIAEKYNKTPAQVALNWVISFHGDSIVAIPGATSISQAVDNAESMNFQLTKEELNQLDYVSAIFKS